MKQQKRWVLCALVLSLSGACDSGGSDTGGDGSGGRPGNGGTGGSAASAAEGGTGGPDGEPGEILVDYVSPLETSEEGGQATVSVSLSGEPTDDVTIALSSSDPSEGTVEPRSLTFTAQNWNAPQDVTLIGVDDDLADGSVVYALELGAARSRDPIYDGVDPDDVEVENVDDETPGITVLGATNLETSESGEQATFSVRLNSRPTDTVTIELSSSDESEGTVEPPALIFTAQSWTSVQTVTVSGVDDALGDGRQNYRVFGTASSDDAGYEGQEIDVAVANVDNDSPGFTLGEPSGPTTEGGGTSTFTIVLNSRPQADVAIALSSSDETEGTVAPALLTFTPENWNSPRTVTATGVDDRAIDGEQPYTIVTGPPVSTDAGYSSLMVPDVELTNIDDDSPGVSVGAVSGSTSEAGGQATFTVRLNSQPSSDVTIAVSSSDPGEGTVDPPTLVFTPQNWNSQQTVTVTGVDDGTADGPQSYNVVTGAAVSTDDEYDGLVVPDVALVNIDNDSPGVTIGTPSGPTSEAGGQATFTVRLNSQPASDVIIALSSSDNGEGSVAPMSLTFTQQNWNAAQLVTATGVDDSTADGPQIYRIVTGNAASADTGYEGLVVADVPLTNTDNDSPGFTVSAVSGSSSEGGGQATFTVRLNSQPAADVVMALSSSDSGEGTVSPPSLTFTPNNWNSPQLVTATGVDDVFSDGPQQYTIVTGVPVSTDAGYSGLVVPDALVTNVDNDSPGVTVSAPSGTTDEGGGEATFTVKLNSQPGANVTIALSSSDTGEGTVTSLPTLTFTPQTWDMAQTVTVAGVDDDLIDGAQPYDIRTGNTASADTGYSGLVVADVAFINLDDDGPGITVGPVSGPTTESAGTATFTLRLTAQPSAEATIALSSSDESEGTVSPASVTFTTSNWNMPRTVTVTGVNDAITDGDQPFTIETGAVESSDANYDGLVVPDVAVTNADNECVGPFILDDLEDGDVDVRPNSGRNGVWFIADDETPGSMRTPGASEVWGPELLTVPQGTSTRAVHVSGQGFQDWGVVIAAILQFTETAPPVPAPYNGSGFGGVRFWMRGSLPASSTIRFEIATSATLPPGNGGSCVTNCFDHWGVLFSEANLVVNTTWRQYDIYFGPGHSGTFRQNGWGTPAAFNPGTMIFVQWNVRGAQPFDIWVDDVRFY